MNRMAFQPARSTRGVIISTALVLAALGPSVVDMASLQTPIDVNEITAERLRAHMADLADDVLEGRETGTRGFDRAAQYVAAQFKEIGLSPITGTYLQRFTITRSRVVEGGTSLVLTRTGRRETLQYGRDFRNLRRHAESRRFSDGSTRAVGDGVSVPGKGVDWCT